MKVKNIIISNVPMAHIKKLKTKAKDQGRTVSSIIKALIRKEISNG